MRMCGILAYMTDRLVKVNVSALGRKGGHARAAAMSPGKLKSCAKKAAAARWAKYYREHPDKLRPGKGWESISQLRTKIKALQLKARALTASRKGIGLAIRNAREEIAKLRDEMRHLRNLQRTVA